MLYFISIIDHIPNVLFLGSACLLLVNFYKVLKLPNFVFLSSGSALVFIAGLLKATYKTFLYFSVCKIEVFNSVFLLLQSIGYVLIAFGLAGLLFWKKRKEYNIEKSRKFILKLVSILVIILIVCAFCSLGFLAFTNPTTASNVEEINIKMCLVAITVIGVIITYIILGVYAFKNNQILTSVIFIIVMVCAFAMGYLGTNNFESIYFNFIAEAVNVIGQLCFFIACYRLTRIKK